MFDGLVVKTVSNVKKEIISLLKNSKNSFVAQTPVLDANILLCHFLNISKSQLICDDSKIITEIQLEKIQKAIDLRLSGLPIAYITKVKEFFGYNFYVDENVLIPKPDTELLVEKAISTAMEILKNNFCFDEKETYKIADICTGSGCIGISVLKELYKNFNSIVDVTLTDISEKALEIAQKNANSLLSEDEKRNINFYKGDLFQANLVSEYKNQNDNLENAKFDMILSNPPYVPTKITDELLSDGRCEPRLALDGDIDGLKIVRRLILDVKKHLKKGGVFFLETGEYNAEEAADCLLEAGYINIFIHKDLAGLLRLVEAHIE